MICKIKKILLSKKLKDLLYIRRSNLYNARLEVGHIFGRLFLKCPDPGSQRSLAARLSFLVEASPLYDSSELPRLKLKRRPISMENR
jgi:hypothetical protein